MVGDTVVHDMPSLGAGEGIYKNRGNEEDGVHFCLLAEFDLDAGATLAHQYPYPTGTDEHRLAELMLPDGAHHRAEDWTIFYLGQSPSNAVTSTLLHEAEMTSDSGTPSDGAARTQVTASIRGKRGVSNGAGLLYVLNCVRMKEDKSMRRGAMVKALAVCTPNPFIGIYKPLLLLALDEYFLAPSPDVLGRLYDAANAISMTGLPLLSRCQKILLRNTDRKDLFEDMFVTSTESPGDTWSDEDSRTSATHGDDQASLETASQERALVEKRPSFARQDSTSSSGHHFPLDNMSSEAEPFGVRHVQGNFAHALSAHSRRRLWRRGRPRDTHYFDTTANFQKISVPIRIPLTVFDEDVGDYSIIRLVQTFTPPQLHTFPPPYHPHLHSNGAFTHPVILILNALLTHKRVLFMGHGLPANEVARMVLAACAMVTGSGQVMRGITATAFPYANLASLDILEEFPGYIAGVTNPRFEELPGRWDVLCNLENGKVTVSKEVRDGTMGGIAAVVVAADDPQEHCEGPSGGDDQLAIGTTRADTAAIKGDCADTQFMDEIVAAINAHFGESTVRVRFAEFLGRFIRVAARYEQDTYGVTELDYSSSPFQAPHHLGSGAVFTDESTRRRELALWRARVEAWRQTKSCALCREDFLSFRQESSIQGYDLHHQLARLRQSRTMSAEEALAIFQALAASTKSETQVTEILAALPSHQGGLSPIGAGLFHPSQNVRQAAVRLFNNLHAYSVGRLVCDSLNAFQRIAYLRLRADANEAIPSDNIS